MPSVDKDSAILEALVLNTLALMELGTAVGSLQTAVVELAGGSKPNTWAAIKESISALKQSNSRMTETLEHIKELAEK